MRKLKHDIWKELWYNRPWVYIPDVIRWMKWYPYKPTSRRSKFHIWLRNCFYLNWQVAWKEV